MKTLYFDTETRSRRDLKTHGAASYFADEEARVLLIAYAVDNSAVKIIDRTRGESIKPFLSACNNADLIVAHNVMFDWLALATHLSIELPIERLFDTLACAKAHALPGSLAALAEFLGCPKKIDEGKELMEIFCKPNKSGEFASPSLLPNEWSSFTEYARQDVVVLREIFKAIPKKNYELDVWRANFLVNVKGVPVDVTLAEAVVEGVAIARKRIDALASAMTNGRVKNARGRKAIVDVLRKDGFALDSLSKKVTKDVSHDLLDLRNASSIAADAKYKAALQQAVYSDTDNSYVLIDTCEYYGAHSGRFAGRGVQLQNLVRAKYSDDDIDFLLDVKNAQRQPQKYMQTAKQCVRAIVKAPRNYTLVCADYSNIEGRVVAWVAGEEWKVNAFRSYDEGKGPDLYKLAVSQALGVPLPEVTQELRQVGKVLELALLYGGGVNALASMCSAYGMTTTSFASRLYSQLTSTDIEIAECAYERLMQNGNVNMSRYEYVALNAAKTLWRAKHPRVSSFWHDVGAAFERVLDGENVVEVNERINVRKGKGSVHIVLPSGRALVYRNAKRSDARIEYCNARTGEIEHTYSSKLVENIGQAIARDVFADCLVRLVKADIDVRLHVHDSFVVLAHEKDAEKIASDLVTAMLTVPPWAQGLPINAEFKVSRRFI